MDTRFLRHLTVDSLIALAIILVPQPGIAQPANDPYTLGRGVAIGRTGARIGGYVAVEWENPADEQASFTFDDLSLFVFGDVGTRVRYFVEIEDSEFWRISRDGSEFTHHADLERLYADYLHSDLIKLRVGKFLTPVGTWNEIHPDPLTWTVSRPLASFATFPTYVTGVQLFGTVTTGASDVAYNVFAQANPCVDCDTNDRQTERLIGGRVRWRWTALEVGVPGLRYIDRLSGDTVTMTGADLVVRQDRVEIRGEATVGHVAGPHAPGRYEHAHYLQALVALTERTSLVAREERARGVDGVAWKAWSLGGLYRPLPAMSFKVEFQHRAGIFSTDRESGGRRVLGSFGVLF